MKKFLLTLSILISYFLYITNSADCYSSCNTPCATSDASNGCSCGTDMEPDILLSVSIHRSVEEGITWDVEYQWLQDLIGAAVTVGGGFGLQTYGDDAEILQSITDVTSPAAAQGYLDSISLPQTTSTITGTYGNNAALAVDGANDEFSSRGGTANKIHLIILNYDPKSGSDGTTTQTTSIANPCNAAIIDKLICEEYQ